MTEWLVYLLRTLTAFGILLVAARVVLQRERGCPRRLPWKLKPMAQGRKDLARLLATSPSSAYARDRVQERLRLVAEDLAVLDRGSGEVPRPLDPCLMRYFAEDHVGFRGGARRSSSHDPDFLRRTEAVLDHLERCRNDPKGDLP